MNPKIKIKKYRTLKKISQRKLSKDLRVSQGYISEIESNKKSPTVRMLYNIADELNVCPRLLLSCKIKCEDCKKDYKCTCKED